MESKNVRGQKVKLNSVKQILINNPCKIIALCETHLKQNEEVSIRGYKWIGLNRKYVDDRGFGFLIINNIVKLCFVEPQSNDGIKIMTVRLDNYSGWIKQSPYIFIMGNKKPKQQNKKQKMNLITFHNTFWSTCRMTTTHCYLGILMLKLAMTNMDNKWRASYI